MNFLKFNYLISTTLLMALLFALPVKAQVTIGSQTSPSADALLDLRQSTADSSSTKGLLLPRVALVSTTAATPLNAHVKGMFVYNTATTGDVTPGIYYNDGSKWVAAVTPTQTTASKVFKVVTLTTDTYTITDEDIILMTDATPTDYGTVTITLPTGDNAPIGRTVYIVNNASSSQVNLVPSGYYINTTAGVFQLQARMLVYLGNGQWQNFSGTY